MSDQSARPAEILVLGDDPWRSAVHTVIDFPTVLGRGAAAPVAMVGVTSPGAHAAEGDFAASDAEALAAYCDRAIWTSVRFLRDAHRRVPQPGGRVTLVEFVTAGAGIRFAVDDAVTGARRALVASAAARWRSSGVAVFLVTLAVDTNADVGGSVLPVIAPDARDLIALLTSGQATALSGLSFRM